LNVSYKIIAKALALKIRHLLPLIVRPEQTGFIKSRYILDNIIAVWEGMEWARQSKQAALFLKIDFAKAYDRIEWPFILAMLQALGFGPQFLHSVEMLFGDASACITINGAQSDTFGLFRSIRQGCPLAPALYVLAAEGFGYLLANSVSTGLVRGISLPDSPSQLVNGHFADDSFLTLIEDEENISNALHCLDTFCQASGSAIQWCKTLCFRQSFLPAPPWLANFGWKWVQHGEVFRFLGIPFAFHGSSVELWNAVLAKIEKKLQYWICKPLSLAGKFQICLKVLAATHVYYSSCWAPSKASYLKLECLLRDFL
jgi:hypothetical protein